MIDISLSDPRWADTALSVWAEDAERALSEELSLPLSEWETSLLACGDTEIARLNAEFRSKPAPTNVLSWPAFELAPARPGAMPAALPALTAFDDSLGDIALAYDTCRAEADSAQRPFGHHVTHLILHGLLHLLGYDHETEADATRMEALEIRALARLGIDDPYNLTVMRPPGAPRH